MANMNGFAREYHGIAPEGSVVFALVEPKASFTLDKSEREGEFFSLINCAVAQCKY